MFQPDQYELLDFGAGRKLERFGPVVLDRPSPAADGTTRRAPQLWSQAHAKFQRRDKSDEGIWKASVPIPDTWQIAHGTARLELKLTPFGHIGLFAEQAENWDWIAAQVKRAARPLKVLNLFAYTGGSTLAAALAGAEVTHVDAAKNVVAWARRNAELSDAEDRPIRWIVEDAPRFVEREVRRGNQYDAVILDPPSYGHGPKGEVWKLGKDLLPLLQQCGELTRDHRAFLLLTCHSPDFGPAEVQATLADAIFGHCQAGGTARPLALRDDAGRRLPAGIVARWPGR